MNRSQHFLSGRLSLAQSPAARQLFQKVQEAAGPHFLKSQNYQPCPPVRMVPDARPRERSILSCFFGGADLGGGEIGLGAGIAGSGGLHIKSP